MLQATTTQDFRQQIRARIVPYSEKPRARTFVVGWHSIPQTFEQIIEDLKPLIVRELIAHRRIQRHHLPDLLQQGWLRLWQALHENSNFLARMYRLATADYVANRCGTSTHLSYLRRYSSYHDFDEWNSASDNYEESVTNIVIGSSVRSTGGKGHALYTRRIDMILDIQSAIGQMVQWCGDDMRKLIALYYVTTSVRQADVAHLVSDNLTQCEGRKPQSGVLKYWTKRTLSELRALLEMYKPFEPDKDYWRVCVGEGDLEPVRKLAEKYADDETRLMALYLLTTSVSLPTVVSELGLDENVLRYAMKRVRHELRWMYASRLENT